ncbi:MAG: hypothetical protein KF898_03165 [Parachlamydiales bacterium]|nr:hypothetical protein [Candidatus Acheromyda pituitae]
MTITNVQVDPRLQLAAINANIAKAASAAADSSSESCAQALYGATEQLWISMEALKTILITDPTNSTDLEIAYTLFADSVCNWEAAYQSFTNSGGQPDAVSEEINAALNETLPDGESIYEMSQIVSRNPSDWTELQIGVSDNTLYLLFEDLDNWINVDGASGSAGLQPTFNSPNILNELYEDLGGIPSSNAGNYQYVYEDIYYLNQFLQSAGQLGPLAVCLDELINTTFFQYNGQSYSLVDIANDMVNGKNFTPTQIQEGEDALNACIGILTLYVDMAYNFSFI